MEKSRTVKKLDDAKSLKERQWAKFSAWTSAELSRLKETSQIPIVIPLADGSFTVASEKILKINNTCWDISGLLFVDRRSAVFYSALKYMRYYAEAHTLLETDQRISKYDLERVRLRERLDVAHLAGDQFKIDLYQSKYDEAKHHLAEAKQELEKRLIQTKYTRVLGNHYET